MKLCYQIDSQAMLAVPVGQRAHVGVTAAVLSDNERSIGLALELF
jgi:hypothetical protein